MAGVTEREAALLREARELAERGEGGSALQAVLTALRERHGEGGILPALQEAKAYAEKQRLKSTEGKTDREILRAALSSEGTLLGEQYSDAAEALRSSVASGASRVCTYCSQVVSTSRLEAHSTLWCPALPDSDD